MNVKHGKGNVASVIKGNKIGRLSWIILVGQCNDKGLFKREVRGPKSEEGDGMTEQRSEIVQRGMDLKMLPCWP